MLRRVVRALLFVVGVLLLGLSLFGFVVGRADPVSAFFLGLVPWLLALICLAWPVTSFIIARRKARRGFPVEPTSPSQAPTVRSNEAQGASPG